jgi:hypothetical protein
MQCKDRDAGQRDPKEDWDGGLCRARREDQLKQRTGITQSLLQRPERTVTAPDDECNTLYRQRRQGRSK